MTTLMLCGGKLVSRHCSAPRTTRTLLLSHHQHYQQRQPTIVLLPSHQRWLSLTASRLDSNTTTDTDKVELFRPTEVLADNTAETVGSAARELVDLSAMGLGGYWPSGLVQSALELLYNHAHLPWWGSIVTLTFLLRLAMLPLMVKMQQVGAKIANLNKDAQVLHARIMDCKARGDKVGESQAGIEMVKLYQVHGVHPLQMLPLGFAQVPVFLSVLYGLKGMAALPVESLRSGGMLWFCDLVVPDPSFCLPLIACGSFLINIQVGGERERHCS